MRFEKVSYDQYIKDCRDDVIYDSDSTLKMDDIKSGKVTINGFDSLHDGDEVIYEEIKLPKRGTKKSAGYDFFAPYDFVLHPGRTILISTGIRVLLDDDKFLLCAPRSGHGFKARIQLDNTVGIIDADYSESSNEGHIKIKLTNDSHTGKYIKICKGDAFMQAVICQYFTVEDDNVTTQRDGGFGSTDNKKESI